MNKKALLAIDTAGEILSLALETDSGQGSRWYFEADAGLRHSELLMDCIDMLLKRAEITPAELSGIACMAGPGSFTGLRIAYATAKGLCLAQNIPFAAVPTLDCMAMTYAFWPGIVAPAIDAKKNAFFCALYRRGERLCAGMDAEAEHIAAAIGAVRSSDEKVLLCGPDAEKLYAALASPFPAGSIQAAEKQKQGYAREILAIAKSRKMFNNDTVDWLSGPEYIRKSDAELQLFGTSDFPDTFHKSAILQGAEHKIAGLE